MKNKYISIAMLILAICIGLFIPSNLSYALAEETKKEE